MSQLCMQLILIAILLLTANQYILKSPCDKSLLDCLPAAVVAFTETSSQNSDV